MIPTITNPNNEVAMLNATRTTLTNMNNARIITMIPIIYSTCIAPFYNEFIN